MIFHRPIVLQMIVSCLSPTPFTTDAFAFTSRHSHKTLTYNQSPSRRSYSSINNNKIRNNNIYGTKIRSTDTSNDIPHIPLASQSNDNNNNQEEWWKDYKLKDSELAEQVRNDFPLLTYTKHYDVDDTDDTNNSEQNRKQLIYFDSAATSQKPNAVLQKLTSYYTTINSNVHRGAHTLSQRATAEYENARDSIQQLINAKSRNEIVFTSGATEALNLLASTYGRANIEKGDEILVSELEHHSNIVPWQMLVEEKGAVLKYIPIDPNSQTFGDMSVLDTLITPNTKIVSVQHVSNVLACIHPISTIVSKVKQNAHPECIIILDACQSIPHMPVDVQSLGVDFIAASGHKMCAPTGIGFLWGKEELLNSMPPYMGGGEMIDEVTMDGSTYAKSPARFEAGTPQIAQAIGLGAAIEYLNSIGGMERIYNYEHELGEYFMKRMKEVEGVTVLGPELGQDRAAIVSFVCDNVHPSDLSTFLDMEGVAVRAGHHCCQPLHRALGYSHSARASLYFYNTKEEVDSFIQILKDTLAFLGGTADIEEDDDFVPFEF